MGDALCSFNPLYGQGMSVATLEALAMRDCLERAPSVHGLWRPFFKRAGRIIDTPWMVAAGSDFAFEGVAGPAPAGRGSELVYRAPPQGRVNGSARLPRVLRGANLLRRRRPCSGRPSCARVWRECWRFEGRWRSSRTGRSRPAASGCSKRTDSQLTRQQDPRSTSTRATHAARCLRGRRQKTPRN